MNYIVKQALVQQDAPAAPAAKDEPAAT